MPSETEDLVAAELPQRSMNGIAGPLSRPFTVLVLAGSLGVSLLLAVVERVSILSGTVWALHLLPVGAATWYGGAWWGIGVSVLAALGTALASLEGVDGAAALPGGEMEVVLRWGVLAAWVLVLSLAKGRRAAERQVFRVDASTGLATSQVLFDLLALEVDRAQRYERPFTLAYLGLDSLAEARQRIGVDATEGILRRVGEQIRGSLRSVDVVARGRGRAFGILLPETGAEAAQRVLARVQRRLADASADEGRSLGFSIGAVTWIRSTLSVPALQQRAYQLMYVARQAGSALEHEVLDNGGDDEPRRRLALHR